MYDFHLVTVIDSRNLHKLKFSMKSFYFFTCLMYALDYILLKRLLQMLKDLVHNVLSSSFKETRERNSGTRLHLQDGVLCRLN